LPAETVEGAAKDPATMIRAENPKKIAIALPIGEEASQCPENAPRCLHEHDATGAVFIRWSDDNQYRDMLNRA
jgi:hypothetical protein